MCGKEAFQTSLDSFTGQQIDDVDNRIRLAAAIGIANSQSLILKDKIDFPETEIALLHPRCQSYRFIGKLHPSAVLDRRMRWHVRTGKRGSAYQ